MGINAKGLSMSPNYSRHHHAITCALLCVCAALSILTLASAASKPATHTVVLRGMKNVPATLVVKVGDTVVWKRPAGDLELDVLAIRYPAA